MNPLLQALKNNAAKSATGTFRDLINSTVARIETRSIGDNVAVPPHLFGVAKIKRTRSGASIRLSSGEVENVAISELTECLSDIVTAWDINLDDQLNT